MNDKNNEQDLESTETEQESAKESVDDVASDVSAPAEEAPAEEDNHWTYFVCVIFFYICYSGRMDSS